MSKKIMLFTLETFKSTGGIQSMTCTLAYSLNQLAAGNGAAFQMWSLHDAEKDLNEVYLPADKFQAFAGDKVSFFKSLWQSEKWPNLSIISHINLAVVGLILKLFNAKCQVWLVAHGVEIWNDLSTIKQALLKRCDKIICVSEFTKQQIIKHHQVAENKCIVLNNALDPFFVARQNFEKSAYLQERYSLNKNDEVLFTLSRINSAEQYKGYDTVINAVAELRKDFPNLKYILAGKSDAEERARLEQLITKHQLQANVILAGFIDDKELTDHFVLADIFAMPSKKEGFGLVLIEATACGTPVICGNADGSIDAIKNGELGTAINPDDISALVESIRSKLLSPLSSQQKILLQEKCHGYFNSNVYTEKLNQLIFND